MNRDLTDEHINRPPDNRLDFEQEESKTCPPPLEGRRAYTTPKSGIVLVLGEDPKILLPIVRSLGRQQIAVDVAWSSFNSSLTRSRYLRQIYDLPSYRADDRQWQNALIHLAQREDYQLIIPATEAALWPFLTNPVVVGHLPQLFVLNEQAARVAFDKSQLQELASQLEIPMPRHCLAHSWQQFADFVNQQQEDVVYKPLCSLPAEQIHGKQFVRIIRGENDLQQLKATVISGWPAIAQTYFFGQGTGIEFLADAGELLFAFQHERLHETVGYGSTYRQSVPLQQDMLHAVRKLVQATEYTGVGMAEFRRNPQTGQWVLLELNGRFWGSLALAVAASADFPFYLYCLGVRGQRDFPASYRLGVRCRDLINDTRWCWRALRGRYSSAWDAPLESQGWEINPVSRWRILGNLLRIPIGWDRYDSFAWDDLKPFWFELRQLTQSMRCRTNCPQTRNGR